MKFTFQPELLKKHKPYIDDPEFDELVNRAMACLLWKMPPEYFDSMGPKETAAWVEAWEQINKARGGNPEE